MQLNRRVARTGVARGAWCGYPGHRPVPLDDRDGVDDTLWLAVGTPAAVEATPRPESPSIARIRKWLIVRAGGNLEIHK